MRYLPIFIFLIPVGLLIVYFGIGPSMLLFSVFLAPILILLSFSVIVMNNEIPNKSNLWIYYGGLVGLLAAAFAIVIPFSHLLGYISLLEAVALWLIELPIYLFFLGIPGSYYRNLKKQQNNV